jgi:hypothetical protein
MAETKPKIEVKEMAQCLAFAYFAENPKYDEPINNKDTEHAIGFYNLFLSSSNVTEYKKKYLSDDFNIVVLKSKLKVTKTEKTKQLSYDPIVKKVYNVARACVESNMFNSPLKNYKFLDQSDPFTKLIKNETLELIKTAFGFPKTQKIDVLSAVDMFAVKRTEMKKIEADFKKYFGNKDDILKNGVWGESGVNDYASIIGKYFKTRALIPISLKLPNNINSKPHVKIISLNEKNSAADNIDPFLKFLAAILDEPSKTKKIIETVIHIDFDKFSVHEKLNWEFPIDFKYKDLKDPKTGKPIENYNLRFNLFAQGHSAGWNGQFDLSTRAHKDTQWVGGMGIASFERLAKVYPQYNRIISKVVQIRVDEFEKICIKLKESNSEAFEHVESKQSSALAELKKPVIHYLGSLKKTKDFFDDYDDYAKNRGVNSISSYTQYQNEVINTVRGFNKTYTPTKVQLKDMINAHFGHAQLSYFLFEGGKNFELYFKQRMFVTIFGLITKMSHKVFDVGDYTGMRNLITEKIQDEAGKQIIHEFKTAPHYIVS